jgi:UDP-N-acetylglucosamine 2-epimerase (non-hydrolysing)
MSKFFFDDLELPKPDAYLEVGSGSHAQQTALIMSRYEEYLLKEPPDYVIVCGDVNSTLACSLVAVKMNIKIAHLEAGLRSYDREMPEEINRIMTDVISDILLIPSEDAKDNLLKEGIASDKVHFVGNIMIDSIINNRDKAENSNILDLLNISPNDFALITLHRPSNVDSPEGLKVLLVAFNDIAKKIKLVFPIHPRTLKNIQKFKLENLISDNIIITEPVGYLDFMKLQMNAKFILTDSGGVQEESTFFNVPCLTLRENTERPITITLGTNQLVKLNSNEIINKANNILAGNNKKATIPPLWDGKTAHRIVQLFLHLTS